MKNSIQNFQNLFSTFEHLKFKLRKNNNSIFNKSFNLSFCVVAALSLLVFTGCESDADDLPQEEESIHELHLNASEGIFDGANGGTDGFYFMPPMVKAPSYSGTFDAGLSPVVEIYETTADETLHATFSMVEGEGSELVRVDEEGEHYVVNWHTDKTGTEVGKIYRIRISVAGTVLGYADVQMAENGKDAKNITDGEAIALVDGRTLPIKFRVEEGTVYVIGSEGGTFSSADGLVIFEIPGGAIDKEIGITVEPSSDPSMDEKMVAGLIFEFGPTGTQFAEPIIVTIKYDPATLPSGIDEELLSIRKYLYGDWVNIEGSTVDILNKTVRASLNSFSVYGVGEREVYPIPELTGVDGYIHRISESDPRFRVSFAVDGVPTGGVYCCPSTLEVAQNAYPDRNHVYLPEATDDDIVAGIVPPLNGIDGYIELMDDGSGRYKISFAVDGFPTGGVACCPSSLEVARSWYPDRNFIFLSPSTEVDYGDYPELTGVDSYITRVSATDTRYMVHFAIDGVPIGGGACCFASLEAALNAYPDRNHAYLPESTIDDINEGVVPELKGVEGYIYLRDQGGYLIRFAVDGVLTGSAACCKLTLEEARNMYPDRNFVFLLPSPENDAP